MFKYRQEAQILGWVKSLWLRFFGHLVVLARTAPEEDHHCVTATALRPTAKWRRPVGPRELPG